MLYRMISWIKLYLVVLLVMSIAISVACSPSATKPVNTAVSTAENSTSVDTTSQSEAPASGVVSSTVIDVVVAGYINHGPLQPTVQAIKDVLAKYGDKVKVTWIDLNTTQGADYFKVHGLTAHMNVIINGSSRYQVNGKAVDFQWFEGQQWTRQDLDTVLAGLVSK